MERVRDDGDVFNIVVRNGLVNSTLHSKELGFSSGNVDGTVKCFDNRFVIEMDVQNGSSNLIFDTSIQYNNSYGSGER